MDQVLKILEENALATPEMISEMLGRTVEEVRAQIKKLEDERVILAYKAIVDDEKAQRTYVQAVIEVRITPERDGGFNRIAERISKFDEVKSCYLMSGSYDLLVFLEGPDLKQLATFVSAKLSTLEGVLSTSTHFMLKTYKEQGTLFTETTVTERLSVAP
ncbi:MAG: Lrp/AsnC family transcriptional regulator [Verrucomicrobiota bacterium]